MHTNKKIEELSPYLNLSQEKKIAVVRQFFPLKPQLPYPQIKHYLANAYQRKLKVVIQINPTDQHPYYVEVRGQVMQAKESHRYFICQTGLLSPYLLNLSKIRHIRIEDFHLSQKAGVK